MSHNLLFRHHTGRMPGPARWYLAVMAMLSLMLMAAHFTVQAHAQKVMQRTVHAWLAQVAGGQVAQVRYRLLRGALTIDGMRIGQGQWAINVPHIYLHASTSAMLSEAVRVSRVHLDGMDVSLPRAYLVKWLQSASSNIITQWFSVMNHADELVLTNGTVRFTDEKNSWQVRKVSGHLNANGFDLNGGSSNGLIRLRGERNHGSFSGVMNWQNMMARGLARITGLKSSLHGSSSGLLHWDADWPQRRFGFSGDVQIVEQPDHGNMDIRGGMDAGNIKVQANCRDVSLTGLGDILPVVNGRSVQTGIWNGAVQLKRQGKNGSWTVDMNGNARAVHLESPNLPAWTIGSMTLNHVVARWPEHQLNAEQVQLHDMDMALMPGPIQSVSPWQLQIARLTFDKVRAAIGIHADSNRLLLPPMDGGGHIEANGYMELNAASAGDEAWRIAGKGHVDKLFDVNINAENVPVVRLRPLLPDDLSLPGLHENSGPLQLSGKSQFQVSLQSSNGRLVLKGKAILSNVMLSQGGDTFLADAVHIDIQQAGMLKMQQLSSIRIDQWRYAAALHPIPNTVESESVREAGTPHRNTDWQVDDLVANDGVISVGNKKGIWADKAFFSLKNLYAGTWSPLVFHASMGGGALQMRGSVDLLSADTKMKLNARLQGALPFFLNKWLMISGSPRLIRGRLDGSLNIKPDHVKNTYSGRLNLVLHQGQFEPGAFPQDPMLPLVGYNMEALSERLDRGGRLKMVVPFRGDWHAQPFSIQHLGFAVLNTIKKRAPSAKEIQKGTASALTTVSHVRLKHGRSFSHNEHIRLWHVVKILRKQRKLIVELIPQLGHNPLDESLISRIRHTQGMIEHYMHTRGIATRRIFPVWPIAEHRHGDITGIKIATRMP